MSYMDLANPISESGDEGDLRTPSGSSSNGWVKIEEKPGSVLYEGIRRLIARRYKVSDYRINEFRIGEPVHLTVHSAWSGYSEFTITSTWDEITIEWGDQRIDYSHTSQFFRDVFEADLSYAPFDERCEVARDPEYGPVLKRLET